MEEVVDVKKQIDFNSLIYHYKSNTAPNTFIGFKSPLRFFNNIKEGNIALEKAEEEQKEFKSK